MKKIFFPILVLCFLSIFFIPFQAKAEIVSCTENCGIEDLTTTIGNIFDFLVNDVAGPLGAIALTVGAILMMVSAGNPNLMSLGKVIFWSAIIGLVLVYGTSAIINTVLQAVDYN